MNEKGEPYRCIRASFERAKRKARLGYLTFHDLRHVFANRLCQRGASLESIAKILGHKGVEMTLRYAHLSPNYLKDVVQLMDQGDYSTATKTATVATYPTPAKN